MFFNLQIITIILALLFGLLFYRKNLKSQKIMMCILILAYFLISLFKDTNVPDYYTYTRSYQAVKIGETYGFDLFSKVSPVFPFEYGFFYLMYICKIFLGNNANLFYALLSVASICITMWSMNTVCTFIRIPNNMNGIRYENWPILFSIYMSYYGLCYVGLAVRVGFALALISMAIAMWIKKKYILCISVFFAAFLIHRLSVLGCILLLIVVFMPRIKRNIMITVWIVIGALMMLNFSNLIVNISHDIILRFLTSTKLTSYLSYLENISTQAQLRRTNIWVWLLGIVFIFMIKEHKDYYKLLNTYFVGLIVSLVMNNIPGGTRIQDFFFVFDVAMIYLFYCEGKMFNRVMRKVIVVGIVVINCIISYNIYGITN